ncbi:type II toxin-antitoxin system RelE/ParE family toxin [Fructilactobacillus florum]|uniref:Type II toxin-antitoxin system RelE/ParE family toxin n=1 Tax=Fructilactobacillus florum DSM 22689 = JCM 16035 TaxID=1423745 RepID=A0A0R2CKX3_9LACO|nr:type II toxin-antitoxin system RelE/ParE family toxin [Fructilactobacillus florum]KRM91872.1 hypothetical protein FC87_GL000697 [Fructilactobacillus florum DSM 22689 = JCM 16035]
MENKKKFKFDYYDYPKFEKFLDSLNDKDAAKLVVRISEIENKGMLESRKMQWVKKLDNNLFEIRSKFASNIQRALYFHVENDRFVITHGFTKKTQKTPSREIKKGKSLRDIYLSRSNRRKR